MLPGVVATDDGRGRAAGCGHGEGVIDAVTWGNILSWTSNEPRVGDIYRILSREIS